MGAEYYGYTSDITCSFPASGKFSDDQKLIYNTVLKASKAVMAAVRPGVSWVEMHRLTYRVMLEALKEGGVVQGDVDKMMEVRCHSVLLSFITSFFSPLPNNIVISSYVYFIISLLVIAAL